MIAAVVALERALRERRPPELGAEDHERVVEHAALLQVGDQPGGRLIDVAHEAGSSRGMPK